jgi:hypothetical protein
MNNLFYVLIARDELVSVIKTGVITLPSFSRVVSPSHASIEVIKSQLKEKLKTLHLNTSEDYVLSLVELNNITLGSEFNLSIFSLKKLYCFDEISLLAYSRNFSQFRFSLIDFDFCVQGIVDNTNKRRLFKILHDEFGISINTEAIEFSKQVENYLATSEKVKTLFNYKREASLNDGNKSLLNDTVTLAMINSDRDHAQSDALYQNYIAGINIAGTFVDKFVGSSEVLHEIDSIDFIDFIQAVIKIIKCEEQSKVPFITKLNGSDLNFDYLIFKLIYLKLKNVFRVSEDFNDLLNLHSELNYIAKDELNIAYILFFSKLEYSDLYTSYYEYKKLDLFNDYLIPQSDSDREIETLNSSLGKKNDEITKLLKDQLNSEERLTHVTNVLEETKLTLNQTKEELREYKDNTSPISVEASNTIPDKQRFQELFFDNFSEQDIDNLSIKTASKLCKEFDLFEGHEKSKSQFTDNLKEYRESSVPIDSQINESFSLK